MIFDKVMSSNQKTHVRQISLSNEVRKNHKDIKFKKAIRGFVTDYKDTLSSYFWVQDDWASYSKSNLIKGKHFDLRLGNLICHFCMQETDELLKNMCYACSDPNDPFLIRLACMFNKEYSYLNIKKSCSKKSPACNDYKNAQMCHSEHIVYIGRLNNLIKVGISRKNRYGSYKSRLSEQGLNEAIVIRGFKSIVEVLEIETWISDLGINDSMKFDDKVNQLYKERHEITLKNYFPAELVKEKIPNSKIEQYNIYPDIRFDGKLTLGDVNHLTGIINHIQGPILICKVGNKLHYWNTRKLLHKEILNFKTKEMI